MLALRHLGPTFMVPAFFAFACSLEPNPTPNTTTSSSSSANTSSSSNSSSSSGEAGSGGFAGAGGMSGGGMAGMAGAAGAGGSMAIAPKPDFGLVDVNPNSVTSGKTISPRDYTGQISAWYFGHAT